jgi:hypothetical protein
VALLLERACCPLASHFNWYDFGRGGILRTRETTWIGFREKRSPSNMTTIMPESQALRNAVKWISSELQEESHLALNDLIQQAILRYDLSPLEAEFLARFYQSGEAKDQS